MSPAEERARRAYRRLLAAYPPEMRERYGTEMEETFLALLRRDGRRAGWMGKAWCWTGAAWDAAVRGGAARLGSREDNHHGQRGGGDMLGTLGADFKYALRTLRRRPAFTLAAAGTIALGIGANASIFTIVDGLLLTPLPYEDPDELVVVWSTNPERGFRRADVNPADAWDWREGSRTLEDLAVFWEDDFNLTGDGAPVQVAGIRGTPNLLPILGVSPALGRAFTEDEIGEGRDGVVLLSHGLWLARWGGDPDVLGTSITLDGTTRTVVGILPAGFSFLDERVDLFVPLDLIPAQTGREGRYAEALARLADGATREEAQRELAAISERLAEEHPETSRGWSASVVALHDDLMGNTARQAVLILLGAVTFVLLMACVNVANLLLAHAGGRARDLAVRAALGAGRGRVVRQLLTESAILAALGGLAGTAIAWWGYRWIVAALPPEVPPVFTFAMDGTVLAFIAVTTMGSALFFGVVPALRTSRSAADALRDGGRAGRGRAAGRLGGTLVVVQTAMALVLLAGGGLLMRSVAGMKNQDFGFDPTNVLTLRVAPPGAAYAGTAELRTFWETVETRVAAAPGVVAAGSTQSHPLMGSNWGGVVKLEGGAGEELPVRTTHASPGLLDALGARLSSGRWIGPEDHAEAPRVAVVNQAFVDRYLAGADALGRRLEGPEASEVTIVGVVENLLERDVDAPTEPAWYLSSAQAVARTRSLVVRTSGDPLEALPSVQQAVWSVDPALPLFSVETMEALVARRVGSYAVIAELMGVFAILALVLGGVGIYGVTAYAAGQRTAEIGVRMAMGAGKGEVVRMVIAQGAGKAVLGLGLGLAGAAGLGQLLRGILVEVGPTDPLVLAVVTALLTAVSVLALWLPARRAARVDPVVALSRE